MGNMSDSMSLKKTSTILGRCQTVDKVRGDAADFSCVKVSQIQCLSGIEALFSVIIEVSKLGGGQPL